MTNRWSIQIDHVPYDWAADPDTAQELTEDPLRPARGIALGALLGSAIWAPILWLVWRWLR